MSTLLSDVIFANRYIGDFVCSIRLGRGSYSLQPVIDNHTTINDSFLVESPSDGSGQGSSIDPPAEDSAAGIFLFNSFVCGAVARALQSAQDMLVLPLSFHNFFIAFWDHQQMLAEDGVHLPGHVTKFLPILDTAADAAIQGCTRIWALAFDGGASAACVAAAATMAKAPFCGRYIEEVVQAILFSVPCPSAHCKYHQVSLHALNLHASALSEMEACTKDPHLFSPEMKTVCDSATIRLPVLPPPSILDREAFSAAVAAAAATLMQCVRDCDVEGARRMGRDDGKWPWRYGGNWIKDCRFVLHCYGLCSCAHCDDLCRHGVGAYSDASGQVRMTLIFYFCCFLDSYNKS